MDNEIPGDPLTALGGVAVGQHEMFRAWVAAGFTEVQAMELLKAFIVATVQKQLWER